MLENLRDHEPTKLYKTIFETQESNFGRTLRIVVGNISKELNVVQMKYLLRAIYSRQVNYHKFAAVWHVPIVDQQRVVDADLLFMRSKPMDLTISRCTGNNPIQYRLLYLSLILFYVDP